MHDASLVKFLYHFLLLTALSALAGAAWVAHRPGDLPALEAPRPGARQRELVDDLKQAAIKRSALFEVSEAELNRHLAKVVTSRMDSPADSWATFDRLALELQPDVAHAILAWNLQGHEVTASVGFRVDRRENTFRIQVVDGSYGRLKVPAGLMRPMLPALEKLATVLQDEIQALFQMNQIRIAQDKLILDPRFP